ncbi:hypothetical protein JVT61DRAFT_3114 [Boletus reticuloceps]|uniref:Uncharacterized protein n=1 Tax=Boletus reticuloceps TaxID=495285 RepID=A0A8I2YPK2_9AGAM|nr:hypothetical protein JVT61DRAFT_3114 [Boletus reticuloceps]
MPYSPRWLMEQGREQEALSTLSMLRRKPSDNVAVRYEYLEIKAEIQYSREASELAYPNCRPVETLCQQLHCAGCDVAKVQAVGNGLLDDVLSTVYRTFVFVSDVAPFTEQSDQSRVVMYVFLFVGQSCFVWLTEEQGHHLLCSDDLWPVGPEPEYDLIASYRGVRNSEPYAPLEPSSF